MVGNGLYYCQLDFPDSLHHHPVQAGSHPTCSNLYSQVPICNAPIPLVPSCNSTIVPNKLDLLWHQRMGHMPFNKMRSISFIALQISTKQVFDCPICPLARQQRLPFSPSTIHTTVSFALVHIDVWGPSHTPTYNGYRYFITFINDFTRL